MKAETVTKMVSLNAIMLLSLVMMLCLTSLPCLAALNSEGSGCPQYCTCQRNIICTISVHNNWELICRRLADYAKTAVMDLKFLGNFTDISEELACLPKLQSLDLSWNSLVIVKNMFCGLHVENFLNLSSNEIKFLPNGVFSDLESLFELDISHNLLSKLEPEIFKGLNSLKILHIGFNMLSYLTPESFIYVPHLEHLGLEFNNIKEFSFSYIPHSAVLKSLNLRGNLLHTLITNVSSVHLWQRMSSLDISENPLECSCALKNLYVLLPSLNKILTNASATACALPDNLKGRSILHVNKTELSCTVPNSIATFSSSSGEVPGTSSVTLQCQAKGYPEPSVMWITPWKDRFFNGSPLLLHSIGLEPQDEVYTHRQYKEPNVFMVSSIHVTSHGNLVVHNIRGSMSGNYTCIAFNIAGNTSVEISLLVVSMVKSVYTTSLLFGGYCATGFLIFGFLVGLIRMVVVWLRHKLYFIVPMFSKSPSTRNTEDATSTCHSFNVSESKPDSNDGGSDNATSSSALLVLDKDSESLEPSENCSESPTSGGWLPHGLFDTLEEAKGKFRDGVERKMERVRKNVQSLKESSSLYVQNIVESSSSAASRMKAGMVFGVETVKYHMQSFKELCGTGDMGAQTISMVSVETDVDSNQQKEIVRQITFV